MLVNWWGRAITATWRERKSIPSTYKIQGVSAASRTLKWASPNASFGDRITLGDAGWIMDMPAGFEIPQNSRNVLHESRSDPSGRTHTPYWLPSGLVLMRYSYPL